MTENFSSESSGTRLLSLDFFRGLTMFLLIGTESGLYRLLQNSDYRFLSGLGWQFEHPVWTGLHFWDFIAPFFMFIVGCAIPFSVARRLKKGESWKSLRFHAFIRFAILFLLGIAYYSVEAGKPVFRLWNILTQVSCAYLIAFFLMRLKAGVQISISIMLVLVSQLIYFLWQSDGFNQPFGQGQNFGTWFDLRVMGTTEGSHWVSFNVVATSAYTIWGVLAGLVLQSGRAAEKKLKILMLAGLTGIIAGFILYPFIPFIKKIATASVVFETGGWCFIMMAFSYWLVDLKMVRKIPGFFAIVGMNSLFIYLFAQVGGGAFLARLALPFSTGILFWAGHNAVEYFNAFVTWFMLWYICYFFYKNNIFIKI